MQLFKEQAPRERIQALVLTLLSGVMAAIFLTLAGLYYYGPTGSYSAEAILLPPGITQQFVFDNIEFLYLQKEGGWDRIEIAQDSYRKFYELVAKDKSLTIVSNKIEDLFRNTQLATLTVTLKKEGSQNPGDAFKKNQEVQFLFSGDYYRIQSLEKEVINWTYFYHPKIYQKALDLFQKGSDE